MADEASGFEREERREEEARRDSNAGFARRGEGGSQLFSIYKMGQGTYVRWGTAAGAGLLSLAAAGFAYEQCTRFAFEQTTAQWVNTFVPLLVVVGLAWLIFRFVGQKPGSVDFMIATEAEMKKVNWSTRREVWGATKVVILTVLAIGFILFLVDLLFMWFFWQIGVLRIGNLWGMFGGSGQ